MMTKQEEYERLIDDRDMAETDLELLNEEIRQLEMSMDEFEETVEWNTLFNDISDLENSVNYMNACIDSLKDEFA